MTDYTDTEGCLKSYAETFDFYMESGRLPDNADSSDPLIDFICEAVDRNPVRSGADPEMPEIVRESAISLLSEMVEKMAGLQSEAQKELDLINAFEAASIKRKRELWTQVKATISQRYSVLEVNLPGYIGQFATDDREAVFAALISDWRAACMERLERSQAETAAQEKRGFTSSLLFSITSDREERRRINALMFKYPALTEIVDIIGRDKQSPTELTDSVIFRFIPSSVSRFSGAREIDRVETGANIERVIPADFSLPDDLFYTNFVERRLRQFGSPQSDKPRKTEDRHPTPRLSKGPIIAAVDTSGSMLGRPREIAFALIRQIAALASRQHRPCYLIQFSVRTQTIDLTLPANRGKLAAFLNSGFTGGTSGEQMLSEALFMLDSRTYDMADVLIISDLQFPSPSPALSSRIHRAKALGTRFYALQIGKDPHLYKSTLDRIWRI